MSQPQTLKQRLYLQFKRVDLNTRALAKVVSAIEYLADLERGDSELEVAKFALVQERRNLRARLEDLLKLRPGEQP